jgi:hypothetical protein
MHFALVPRIEENGLIAEDGRRSMGDGVGRLEMNMIIVTVDRDLLMTDLPDPEILLTTIVCGGLVPRFPHHVVQVSVSTCL